LPFSEEDCPSLPFRHCFKRLTEPEELPALVLSTRGHLLENVRIACNLALASAAIRVPACQTYVPRDREKPGQLDLGDNSALKGSERMHECGLERIFGLVPVAKVVDAVCEDAVSVVLVERLDGQ
jgi:hypothetical protein